MEDGKKNVYIFAKWGFERKYSTHIKEVFSIVGDILATFVCGHLYIIHVVLFIKPSAVWLAQRL